MDYIVMHMESDFADVVCRKFHEVVKGQGRTDEGPDGTQTISQQSLEFQPKVCVRPASPISRSIEGDIADEATIREDVELPS